MQSHPQTSVQLSQHPVEIKVKNPDFEKSSDKPNVFRATIARHYTGHRSGPIIIYWVLCRMTIKLFSIGKFHLSDELHMGGPFGVGLRLRLTAANALA